MLSIDISNHVDSNYVDVYDFVINCPVSKGREWMHLIYVPNVEKYIIDSVNKKGDLNDNL